MFVRRLIAAVLLVPLALTSCSSADSAPGAGGQLQVVTSFYPLQFAVQQIGGAHVHVTNLTKPGAEPHHLELTGREVAEVAKSDLFVYQQGISGAVDQTARNQAADTAYDVSAAADLNLISPDGIVDEPDDEHQRSGATDPHFWLDPVRYRGVAQAIAQRLSSLDPANQADYAAGLESFGKQLDTLAADLTQQLRNCPNQFLVTSHAAFGYLAARTGLRQVSIAGLGAEAEPPPAHLAVVARFVKANRVTTIYTETAASLQFARTVAEATGAQTRVLDPVEGITESSAGRDYFAVMRANLATLRAGQGCT